MVPPSRLRGRGPRRRPAAAGARGRDGRPLRALRGREAQAGPVRLRRPARRCAARPRRRPRVRRRPALAVPPPLRRRVPGREPRQYRLLEAGSATAPTSAWSATPTRPSTPGTAPTRASSPASPRVSRPPRSCASRTTTAPRPRCSPWPTPCSAGRRHGDEPRHRLRAHRSRGRFPPSLRRRPGGGGRMPAPAATRGGRGVVATGRAHPHPRPARAVRGGLQAAGIPCGCAGRRVPRPARGRGACRLRRRRPPCCVRAPDLREMAGEADLRRTRRRAGERREPRRPVRLAQEQMATDPAATWPASWLAAGHPRGDDAATAATPSSWPPSTRPRAWSGRSCSWPGWSRPGADRPRRHAGGAGRGAPAALRRRDPGPGRAALLVGRAAHVRDPLPSSRSPRRTRPARGRGRGPRRRRRRCDWRRLHRRAGHGGRPGPAPAGRSGARADPAS